MSANNGKANFAPSHGQSLADQSFESIKSKEVRDSMDPAYDIKFQSLALNNPTTSGWNVQSTHEVSPDGRAYRSDTLATTGGVEKVNGGIAEYQGHNEQRSSASEVGDDKNFVKKSAESTKTHLQEKVVVGDEKNGRMEMKTSSTTSASSSQVFQSSSTFESGDEKFLKDNVDYNQRQKHFEHEKLRDLHQQQHDLRQQQDNYEQQLHKNYFNEFHSKHQETQQSQNIREQEVTEKTRRVVELDKSSPEYQQHVQYLMQQPGEIVSNTVEYPQPNVKMITTVKRLPDGTIVRNKRYETEATAEEAAQYRQTQANTTTTKQTTTKRGDTHDEVNQSTRNYQNRDDVDNARRQDFSNKKSDLQQYATNENVTKSFKTVKESTQRHVTKSSSQTVEEHNTAKSSDFSTHGFPSVRDDKPTQEFPTDHPQRLRSTTFPNTENFPKGSNVITTVGSDGVIKVSTQVQKTMKHKTNAEHIVETEIVGGDDDFTTLSHKPSSGFPTVSDHVYKQTSSSSQQHFSNTKNADKTSDFSSHGFPSVRDDKLTQEFPTDRPDRYTQQVNNETHSKNYERIIEHNVVPGKDSPIRKSTDFSTHGFPSVRSPTKTPNSFEYPAQTSSKVPQKSSPTQYKTTTTTRVTGKPPVATSAPTTKFIQKEKEVDAAHRAFAASLRSESPVDSIRREHYTDYQKQTPRSSISSNKTFRRDVREGSHDSGSSRFSSGTVTRQSPSKSVGKTVVTKHTTIKSRNVNGSNETIDLTSQHPTKSPSPTKGHTTTTTTKTIITTKTKADDVPKPGGAKDSSDTIAARRSLFEKNTTQSPVHSPRRPSYMDHTKSSLEHTRRDSLEINKSSYARKVSTDEETQYERRPNSSVKFDVPERITKKKVQEDEDMNVEEIFDLELLEELLEKVTSYDLRRRIRAQIRIVKKMMLNSSSVETSHISSSTTYSSKKHHEETDAFNDVGYTGSLKVSGDHVKKETLHGDNVPKKPEDFTYKPRDRSHSPLGKTISSSLKEVRRDSDTNSSMSHHYKIESHMETSSSQYSNKESRKSRERSISPDMKKQSPQSKQSISPKRTSISSSQKSADRKNEFFSTKTLRSTQKSEEQLPIWTERKNILKSPSNDVKSKKISETRNTTIKTSTAERQRKPVEEDCIISSYGIGPTDENGLPLFGIRALKKKKLFQNDDIEQKVTGYVVEEKSYSENQGTPITERKEYVFSTDAGELNKLEKQMKSERMTSNKSMKSIQGRKESTQGEDDLMKSFKKIERRGSVKEMSEKFVRKESSQSITEKQNKYPKAGLILRTRSRSGSHDENIKSKIETKSIVTESESETETVKIRRDSNKKTSTKSTRSFLNAAEEERKVTGIDDVLERMRNADNITETGDSQEDQEARALLNKFFGASVIMSGVEAAMPMTQTKTTKKIVYSNNEGSPLEEVKTTQITTKTIKSNSTSSKPVAQTTCFIEGIEDELLLRDLLEKSTTYEERRKIRARLRELMAEREEKPTAQTKTTEKTESKEKDGSVVTTTTKVTTRTVTKPESPFNKFRQLDKQNSLQSSKSTPTTPTTPGGGSSTASPSGSGVIFKFTDPALNARAATAKEQLLQWCQVKTQEYENIQITNFSSSWNDGLAFCALIHHFLPDAFDYSQLTAKNRRHNFQLAFNVADEKAGIAPLLDVDDMVMMKRPDWKCVFVYVQSIYRRFRNCQ